MFWIRSFRGVAFLTIMILLALPGGRAMAQEAYPSRPITLHLGWGAGGGTDVVSRPLVAAAGKILKQPVIIQNTPGASGAASARTVASARPDGYTLLLPVSTYLAVSQMEEVPYDLLKDFRHILQYGEYQYGLVVKSDSPWNTCKELIQWAAEHPGDLSYSTIGVGSPQHLVMEQLASKANLKLNHIPFGSTTEAKMAVMGGHVKALAHIADWSAQVRAGQLRLLASFGQRRMKEFPEVPTLKELGYDVFQYTLFGISGPKGLPDTIVKRLNDAFSEAIKSPDFIKIMEVNSFQIVYRNDADFTRNIETQYKEVERLLKLFHLHKSQK